MKKLIKVILLDFKTRFKESDFISPKYPNEYGENSKWLFYKFLLIVVAVSQLLFLLLFNLFLFQINPFFGILSPYSLLLMIRWNQYWGVNS